MGYRYFTNMHTGTRVTMSRGEGIAFDRYASEHGRRLYGMAPPDQADRDRMSAALGRLAAAGEGAVLVYHGGPVVSDEDLAYVAAQLAPEPPAASDAPADQAPDQPAEIAA